MPGIVNEADFIHALRALPLHPGARGLADDAAVIEIGGEALVVTHDMIAEGVHYLPGIDPFDIAWKLVAVNLSDLAAKGADPVGVLVGASLDGGSERFVEGLRAILNEYRVPLLGGDTIRPHGPASFGCTAIGRATTRPVPARNGARGGDIVYLCGTIGAARRGWLALSEGESGDPGDVEAYLHPRPLLAEGKLLAPHASAMMDVSDGLMLDASRIAEASAVTLDLTTPPGADHEALSWGDDYALLLTAATLDPALPGTPIGRVLDRGEHALLLDGRPMTGRMGFQH